ncbi:MAG: tRNA 2-selenouridine synthase [Cyclobacteriaceae bacterium]|jgi:tRNA 2-selenouridine synthase
MIIEDFKSLFLQDCPMIDVRAPIEFAQGAFPTAINLPILFDDEREQVGICYKQRGADAAEQLGHTLVSGATRDARLLAWQEFITNHSDALVYCFRGGLRSQLTQDWLLAAGTPAPRIKGGYKALRGYLLRVFEALPPLMILAGKTGSGKTTLLAGLPYQVDLEDRAQHRGSAFGKRLTPQPSQIDFENAVAIDFLKLADAAPTRTVVVEDEGRLIGRVSLPLSLQAAMKQAPLVLLEVDLAARVAHIHEEYVVQHFAHLLAAVGDHALAQQQHESSFLLALEAIKKRLGGVAHGQLHELMSRAFKAQQRGDFELHRDWIQTLLVDYYDPMYDYQIGQKAERIIFRGNADSVREYLTR